MEKFDIEDIKAHVCALVKKAAKADKSDLQVRVAAVAPGAHEGPAVRRPRIGETPQLQQFGLRTDGHIPYAQPPTRKLVFS